MESTITGAVRNLPLEDYHFILALLIVIALYSFYCFIREWKRWRLIKDTPTARLRSAPQGYVELEGKGKWRSEYPIYAPLTNHKCLWYHSRIERQETILEKNAPAQPGNLCFKAPVLIHFYWMTELKLVWLILTVQKSSAPKNWFGTAILNGQHEPAFWIMAPP